MKTHFLVILSLFMLVATHSNGQEKTAPSLYLSHFTFSPFGGAAGYVKLTGSDAIIKSIRITGKDAKLFRVSAGHQLSVNTATIKKGTKWLDITISAQTSNGEIKRSFRIVKDEFLRNKVIAHRGAWKNTGETENSVGSLKKAIELGCEGSEFDVHLSSDSVIYVHHDPDVDGVRIEQTPSGRLSEIKLSNGESLPTLVSHLQEGLRQNRTKLILEIKPSVISNERAIALTQKTVRMVEDMKAQGWVDYISFDYDVCKEVLRLAPYAKVLYLKGDKSPEEVAKDGLYGLDYHYSVFQKNTGWIKEARQRNLAVNAWTVNEEPVMDWLIGENVDFITTNEPEILLKKILKK